MRDWGRVGNGLEENGMRVGRGWSEGIGGGWSEGLEEGGEGERERG